MVNKNKVSRNKIIVSLVFFLIAGLCEIGGGYLVWLWLRDGMSWILGVLGGFVLFAYGIIPTLQPSNFGRIYTAYGGFFMICSILWEMVIDKKKPDKYGLIGSAIAVLGAAVIFYTPR